MTKEEIEQALRFEKEFRSYVVSVLMSDPGFMATVDKQFVDSQVAALEKIKLDCDTQIAILKPV